MCLFARFFLQGPGSLGFAPQCVFRQGFGFVRQCFFGWALVFFGRALGLGRQCNANKPGVKMAAGGEAAEEDEEEDDGISHIYWWWWWW